MAQNARSALCCAERPRTSLQAVGLRECSWPATDTPHSNLLERASIARASYSIRVVQLCSKKVGPQARRDVSPPKIPHSPTSPVYSDIWVCTCFSTTQQPCPPRQPIYLAAAPLHRESDRMSFLKSRTATPVPPAPPPSVPELLTPPPAFNNLRLPKALPGQEENLIALGKHFDDAALELPVKEGGDGAEKRGLSEREKMFLVRLHKTITTIAATGSSATK